MRPWLRWLLAASALASAVALWWPDSVSQAVTRSEAAAASSQAAINAAVEPVVIGPGSGLPRTALPSRLHGATLDPANFDPFVGVQPPPPPPPQVQPVPAVIAPPPPAPTAPPLTYRYLGQMVDPSGKRLVYLGKGDKDVLVAIGTQLEEGYVVEAIANDGIQLRYPPLDVRAVINIPPARDTISP